MTNTDDRFCRDPGLRAAMELAFKSAGPVGASCPLNNTPEKRTSQGTVHRDKSAMLRGELPLKDYPVAMAYVPMQRLSTMYESGAALTRGTLFPELDKPFMGCGGGRL